MVSSRSPGKKDVVVTMETGAVGERFKETFELQCGKSRDIPKVPVTKEGNGVSQAGQVEV